MIILHGILGVAAAADWRKVETGSLAWLHAIEFVNADRGWAGGSNGTLLSTVDGGLTWKKAGTPLTDTIRDIHFENPLSGWLLVERDRFRNTSANRSYLVRTTDGGMTWSNVEFVDAPDRYARMIFTANGAGFVVGEGGYITAIPDTMNPQVRLMLPERYLMLSGKFFGPEKLLLVGGAGSIVWTDDGGRNWNPARFIGNAPTAKFYSVYFADQSTGWAAGNEGSVFSTRDGGKVWERQPSQTDADLYDIRFRDRDVGFAVGERGIILRTLDSGRTWAKDNSGLNHRLERLAFSRDRVFAVGFGGAFVTDTLTWKRSVTGMSH